MSFPLLRFRVLALILMLGAIAAPAQTLRQRFREVAPVGLTARGQTRALAAGNPKVDAVLQQLVGGSQGRSMTSVEADARAMQVPAAAGRISVTATAGSAAQV